MNVPVVPTTIVPTAVVSTTSAIPAPLAASGLPSPYTQLSPLRSAVVAIVLLLMVAILILGLCRTFCRQRQLQRARDYVDQSISRIPPAYNSRPLIEALMPRYFDVPAELIGNAAEPQLSVARLGWFLGLLDVLGPNSNLYFGDLLPNVHPSRPRNVVSPEFWLDFEHEGHVWAIWLPDRNRFEVIDRKTFGGYVSIIRQKHSREETMAWLKRHQTNGPK